MLKFSSTPLQNVYSGVEIKERNAFLTIQENLTLKQVFKLIQYLHQNIKDSYYSLPFDNSSTIYAEALISTNHLFHAKS